MRPRRERQSPFKSTTKEEESEDSEEGDEDEKMALITRKFKNFMKKKRQNFKRRPFSKGERSKKR